MLRKTSKFIMTFCVTLNPAIGKCSAEYHDPADLIVLAPSPPTLMDTVGTGSRLGLTQLEIPASVETLPGDLIRARGDLSIVDAITRATGLSSVANPGNGGTGLAARGFSDQGSVMILYDGVRLYPGAGTVSFPTDPWTVDRIEVLRGPASVLYGQGAIGGAINVISKKPDGDRTRFDGEAGYGSQDSWRIGAGIGGPVSDHLSYRVDASRTSSDGWVDRGGSKGLAVSGALRLQLAGNFALTLSDDYGDQRPMRYFGTPLIAGRLDDRNARLNYNVADADIHYRDNRTTLKAEWGLADGVAFTSTLYRLTAVRHWRNLETYSWNPAAGQVDRADYLGIDHDQTQIGHQTTVAIRRPLGGLRNDLVIGFDSNWIRFRHGNNFYPGAADIPGSPVDPFRFNPGLFETSVAVIPAYRTRTRQYSVFAEDRLMLTDRLSLVAGGNYEHAAVERFTIAPNGAEVRVLDKRLANTTWRIGAVYQPVGTVSFYGQYATAVDPLGSLITFSPSQSQFRNATGRQVELGVKATFLDGRGALTFAGYRIVKKNLLVRDPDNLTSTVPLQVGQRSSKGLEASLVLDLSGGVTVEANGTVLDARYDRFNAGGISYDGKTPPNVPETTANLWLGYSVTDRLHARAGLRYVGRTFSDNANRFRIPAYAVVDTGLTYALTANVALTARLYNLFDKAYATTTYADEQWLLGRPRSVDFSVSARF